MNAYRRVIVILVFIIFFITSCDFTHEINATAELGPNTQLRIIEINETLREGVNIGQETRDVIDRINENIENGIQVGFDEATLDRIDHLLEILENDLGVEVGLDPETRAQVDEIIKKFSPDQWESMAEEIIKTLEGSTSEVAKQMASEIEVLITETRQNSEHLIREVGTEFRCNIDFLGAKPSSTVNQLIGGTVAYGINLIIDGDVDLVKLIPGVCHITPEQIDLSKGKDEEVVFNRSIIRLIGYNFEKDNLPTVYIVDENGEKSDSVKLGPAFINTTYEIHLNLQKINFASVPARSRIVFEWPNLETTNSVGLILPPEPPPTRTPIPQPQLTIEDTTVNIHKGPDSIYDVIGSAQKGAKYRIKHKNHDASWWQIDYNGEDGWVDDQYVTTENIISNNLEVAPFIPLIPTPTPTSTPTPTPTPTAIPRKPADLLVKDLSFFPSSPKKGQNVTARAKVCNQGELAATGIQVYLKRDTSYSKSYRNLSISRLNPGSCKDIRFDYPYSQKGQYNTQISISSQSQDSNPNNNQRSQLVRVSPLIAKVTISIDRIKLIRNHDDHGWPNDLEMYLWVMINKGDWKRVPSGEGYYRLDTGERAAIGYTLRKIKLEDDQLLKIDIQGWDADSDSANDLVGKIYQEYKLSGGTWTGGTYTKRGSSGNGSYDVTYTIKVDWQ